MGFLKWGYRGSTERYFVGLRLLAPWPGHRAARPPAPPAAGRARAGAGPVTATCDRDSAADPARGPGSPSLLSL